MRTTVVRSASLALVLASFLGLGSVASAQESKSTALVKELTQLLDQAKMEAIAAKDPSSPDLFVAALYYPGSQLLVVSAKYSVPVLLGERLAKKEYREIYTDLNSAAVEGTKTLVFDVGADGLKPRKDDNKSDSADLAAKSYTFDGDWKKQKLASEDDYTKAFSEADARYAKMLAALIAQAKK
jgi:hypothetical protein